MKKVTNRFHVELALASIETDIAGRETLVNNIGRLAPQSPIYVIPAVPTAVANLGATFVVYKAKVATAATSAKQHALDVAALNDARNANDKALLLVKALTEAGAQSATEIESMAFTARSERRPPPPPLVPPASIDIQMGKKGGKVKVAAHEIGKTKRRYAAQTSPDPIGPTTWTTVPGAGKSRWLAGRSGTSVWVRFALMHGQLQSDWSTAVLVTFP